MKKIFKKALSILFCAALLIASVPFSVAEAADDDIYYCREAIGSLPESDKLVYVYDQLCDGIESTSGTIQISNSYGNVSIDELQMVFDAYRRDYSEHFWLGNTYTYSYFGSEDNIVSVSPTYIMTGDELETAKLTFESTVSNILNQLSPSMTDYEKEKKLHDILASRITYIESANSHNAYGALVEGKAVCEGYAEALQCLLHRIGIQSLLVTGSSYNPSTGTSEAHAWNMVKINGKYYHTDLTWNDQDSTLYYAYFNVSDNTILKDHIIDETEYPLPVCNSEDDSYHTVEGIIITDYTAESVGQLLYDNDLILRASVPNGADDFISWFTNNVNSIAAEIGIEGAYGYSYSILGDEVIIIIDTCMHKNLTLVPAVSPTCTEDGNTAYYLCTCGKIFSDSKGKSEILDPSQTVVHAGHTWTEKVMEDAYVKDAPLTCSEFFVYYYGCKHCDEISSTFYYVSDKTIPHSPVSVEGIEPSCSEGGKKPYYRCSCGRYFRDAEGLDLIENINAYGNLPRLSHGELNGSGVCTLCGSFVELTSGELTAGLVIGIAFIVLPALIPIFKKASRKK